jgi:transposase
VRERFPTEAQLAAEAGVAPVTKASGQSRGVVCRFACNKLLRAAVTPSSRDTSSIGSPFNRRSTAPCLRLADIRRRGPGIGVSPSG